MKDKRGYYSKWNLVTLIKEHWVDFKELGVLYKILRIEYIFLRLSKE